MDGYIAGEMAARIGLSGGNIGGAIGTKVSEDGGGEEVPFARVLGCSYGDAKGDGDFGLVRAPAHASRRSTYVLRPSFHVISSSSFRFRLLFRETAGWARESGLSYL